MFKIFEKVIFYLYKRDEFLFNVYFKIMARKTNKSVSKRIKVSGSGKMLYRKAGYNHFRRNKSTKQKRAARTKDCALSTGFRLRYVETLVC